MKKFTKLMSKLYSEATPAEEKEVMDKIEEAKEVGSSESETHTFTSEGEDVVITDKSDASDVTVATETEDGNIDLKPAESAEKSMSEVSTDPAKPESPMMPGSQPTPAVDPSKTEDPGAENPVAAPSPAVTNPVEVVKKAEDSAEVKTMSTKVYCSIGDTCTYKGKEVTVTNNSMDENGMIEVSDGENTMKVSMNDCQWPESKTMSDPAESIDNMLAPNTDEPSIADSVKPESPAVKTFSKLGNNKAGSTIDNLFTQKF